MLLILSFWVHTFSWLASRPYYQVFALVAVTAASIGISLKFLIWIWPTWYRRTAAAIVAWAIAPQLCFLFLAYFTVQGRNPPAWLTEYVLTQSASVPRYAFICVSALAILDYLVKYHSSSSSVGSVRRASSESPQEEGRRHSAKTDDPTRTRYLQAMRLDLQNRLAASAHHACLLDIHGRADANSTALPWSYRVPDSETCFDGVDSLVEYREQRFLLMGAPGSGKTTSLIQLALKFIDRAHKDSDAPLPVFANLSVLDPAAHALKASHDPGQRQISTVRELLVHAMTRYPGVSRLDADRWVRDGDLALVLDGLDELRKGRSTKLLNHLNTSIYRDFGTGPLVVACRTEDYCDLKAAAGVSLHLSGALELQPLSESQIDQYLHAANADQLSRLLPSDRVLREMATNPLTLSMMVLAYGDVAQDCQRKLGPYERRQELLELFVGKLLQRNERRRRGIPFDKGTVNSIPESDYEISPDKVDRGLGWIANETSLRMKSVFSTRNLYAFLNDGHSETGQRTWWRLRIAEATVTFFALILVALSITPPGIEVIWTITGVACVSSAGIGGALFVKWLDGWSESASRWRDLISGVILLSMWGVYLIQIVLHVGVTASALVVLSASRISPFVASIVAINLGWWTMMVIESGARQKWITVSWWATLIVLHGILVGLLPGSLDSVAGSFAIASLIGLSGQIYSDRIGVKESLAAACALFAMGITVAGLSTVVAALTWYHALIAGIFVYQILSGMGESRALVILFAPVFFALGRLFGPVGIVVGCFPLFWVGIYLTMDDGGPHVEILPYKWTQRLSDAIEVHVVNRVLTSILAVQRVSPLRFQSFIRYCFDARLLIGTGRDRQFAHRLVRDHFAIRHLRAQLSETATHESRVAAIATLGYQGEGALETLALFAADADPEIRAVATSAISNIPHAETRRHIHASTRDVDVRVRRAAVQAAGTIWRDEELVIALCELITDDDVIVRLGLIKIRLTDMNALPDPSPVLGARLQEVIAVDVAAQSELVRIIETYARTASADDLDRSLAENAVELLCLSSMAVARTHLETWYSPKSPLSIRQIAALAIGRHGQPNDFDWLLTGMDSVGLERACIEAMGKLGSPEAVPILDRILRETDCHQSHGETAATSLGELNLPGAVSSLAWAIRNHPTASVREEVARRLRAFVDPLAIESLISAWMNDDEEDVSRRAGRSLQPHIHRIDLDVLRDALHIDRFRVSRTAVSMLKDIETPEAAKVLSEWSNRQV